MINRSPLPTRDFLVIRNEVVRDERLSFLARGLLISILSRPNNWRVSAERLAAQTNNTEGIKSIRRALREMEQAGYLNRRRMRDRETGQFTWEQVFYDVALDRPVLDGSAISPSPMYGEPPFGEGPSIEEPTRRTEKEDVNELSGHASGHSVPYGARDEVPNFSDDVEQDDDDKVTTQTFTDWRAEDRRVFADLVITTTIRSDGSAFTKGKFGADQFYDAFRRREKAIKWPGKYLASLDAAAPTCGVDDWLMNLGLERVWT